MTEVLEKANKAAGLISPTVLLIGTLLTIGSTFGGSMVVLSRMADDQKVMMADLRQVCEEMAGWRATATANRRDIDRHEGVIAQLLGRR